MAPMQLRPTTWQKTASPAERPALRHPYAQQEKTRRPHHQAASGQHAPGLVHDRSPPLALRPMSRTAYFTNRLKKLSLFQLGRVSALATRSVTAVT